MPAKIDSHVAIIGAGLSGLTLALALHAQGIPSTIYETRSSPSNIGGAIMLSPNALRILDSLSLYGSLLPHAYAFDTLDWKRVIPASETAEASSVTVETYEFGGVEKYEYPAIRIYRTAVINVLMEAIKDKNIPIVWGKKFKSVLLEDDQGVQFEFADGAVARAGLLVGADGIHSTVRKHLYPELTPEWTGMAGITAAVPTSKLQTADGKFPSPVTYMHPSASAFVVAPQEADGSEVLIGKQKAIERELSREEWDAVRADKDGLVRFLQEGNDVFPAVVKNATSAIPHDKINVWPFYVIPKLDSWASEKRRVLVLGDAAHAIPPSAGQGINQAFEDVYVLALLLAKVGKHLRGEEMRSALSFWQAFRQERVEKVLDLNKQIDLRRLPEGSVQGVEKKEMELEWLYNADFEAAVKVWADGREQGADEKGMARKAVKECPVHKFFRALGSGRQ